MGRCVSLEKIENNQPFTLFDRKTTTLIKIFALLLMVLHHTWGFPSRIVDAVPFLDRDVFGMAVWEIIQTVTKTCVPIFAFLTGYFYAFNKNKTLIYSIRKIMGLLKSYWYFLFLIILPIAYYFGHRLSFGAFILQLFAINPDKTLTTYAWYVYFFIFSMILLPYNINKLNGSWKKDLTRLFLFHIVFTVIYMISGILPDFPFEVSRNIYSYYPVVLSGYFCGKHNVFQTLYDKFKNHNAGFLALLAASSLFLRGYVVLLQPFWINFDTILIPLIVYSLILAVQPLKESSLYSKISFMDKHIVNIWFNHAIFVLIYTASFLQPILYFPRYEPFVTLLLFSICIPLSMYVNKVDEIINKLVKKLTSTIKKVDTL